MSKVLVTGGTGFIGSHLVEKLLEEGRDVKVLALKTPIEPIEKQNEKLLRDLGVEIVYGDIRDIKSIRKAIKGVDTVFHLAAISRPMNITNEEYYDTNVKGVENMLEVSKEAKVKKFVHVSTVSVLGLSPDGHPLSEDEYQYDDLRYGQTKREGERIALLYHCKYSMPVVVVRPCLVYGPRCLVRLIMFKFVKHMIFPVFNNGKAKMEFAYVGNVVDAILLSEKNESAVGETFNVTDGKSYKIGKVLNTIADELEVKRPWINIPTELGVALGFVAELLSKIIGIYPPFSKSAAKWMSSDVNVYDCTKIKMHLGYEPKVSLREGIRETVNWYKEKGLL